MARPKKTLDTMTVDTPAVLPKQDLISANGIPDAVLKAAKQHKILTTKQEDLTHSIIKRKPHNDSNERKLFVFDRLASKPRTHDFRDGKGVVAAYHFENDMTPLPVPYSAAIRLVGIAGFEVMDENGNTLEANKERKEEVSLLSNQTVAYYSELTRTALRERAQNMGAPKALLVEDVKREDLINWLTAFNQERKDAVAIADKLGITKSLDELVRERGIENLNEMSEDEVKFAVNNPDRESHDSYQQVTV